MGHGRRESRWHYVCGVPRGLPDSDRWPGLKAIGMVISNTERDGKECVSIRYYIMTRKMPCKKFAAIVKGHWAIENELHWQLDVTFREDHCRIQKGNADANFSILRRIALMLLKNEKTAKLGVKNKRLSAGWDEDYLLKVLVGPCHMVQSPCLSARHTFCTDRCCLIRPCGRKTIYVLFLLRQKIKRSFCSSPAKEVSLGIGRLCWKTISHRRQSELWIPSDSIQCSRKCMR
jgi:predicted transposase YbfD/YdcC